ncbi:MAG: hypothetical protein K9G67_15150 [Bacteroidales bacterium]|nr:hypothetical protein [Bacteroidales bacterium]MCF8345496.1 hypothetical protein [Bacteroidales bacterium]MCF8351171.1 hypothetical protein [Bacteroidales bacterium]MCF8377691.1 hypothetical protein [Bacteroidales bacterium]
MSLDTVLKIGNSLRTSDNQLQHFRYVKPCPPDTERENILRINIPVKKDFSFDWEYISLITDENLIKNLYYLTFKTSGNDNSIKYLFGDIYFEQTSSISRNGQINISEKGNYWLSKESFKLASKDFKLWQNEIKIRFLKDYISANSKNLAEFEEEITKDFEKWKKNKEKFKPHKKLQSLTEDLVSMYGETDKYDEIYHISKFREKFQDNLETFEKILTSATSFRSYFNDKSLMDVNQFFSDDKSVKELHVKEIINAKKAADLKKFLKKDNLNELNENDIKKLLKIKDAKIFIHFDFEGKHWYEADAFEKTKEKMYLNFFEKNENLDYLPNATLYKTLCSGREKNDKQFPGFSDNNKSKSKSFNKNEVEDLFYGIKLSSKGCMTLGRYRKRDIKIIVLPKGEHLKEDDYMQFHKNFNENSISLANTFPSEDNLDDAFIPFVDFNISQSKEIKEDIAFDVIFTETGGNTERDLVEISGIKQSYFKVTQQRIAEKKKEVKENCPFEIKLGIGYSFKKVLGSYQPNHDKKGNTSFKKEVNPKYQSHLLNTLPKIYTNQYYNDALILSAFIEKVEFTTRQGKSVYNSLLYDLTFLLKIQNTKKDKYMEIVKSTSFKIGALLGSLARNFSGKNSPINSFEKNYVGNLSRRIGTIEDFIKLKNDIEQKLVMHEKTQFTLPVSDELSGMIKEFNEIYDKEACAFGFFDSYFKPFKKQSLIEKLEKVIEQNKDAENENEMIEELNEVIEKYKEE